MIVAATENVARSLYTLWGIRDLPQALLHGLKALAHLLLLGAQPMECLTGSSHAHFRVARLSSEDDFWHQSAYLSLQASSGQVVMPGCGKRVMIERSASAAGSGNLVG